MESNSNSTKILIGLIVGSIIGIIFNLYSESETVKWIISYVTNPIGTAFLRGLMMVVVPLVFSSLAVGVAKLGSGKNVGLIFGRLGIYYLVTSLIAILIGQTIVSTVQPGAGIPQTLIEESREKLSDQVSGLMEKSGKVKESLWPGLVSAVIPRNIISSMANGEMLAVIFVALLLGIGLLRLQTAQSKTLQDILQAVSDLSITGVGWIMKFAPYAVAALMISSVSQFGFEIMSNVAKYIAVVIIAYAVHFFAIYSLIVKFVIRMGIIDFYKKASEAIITAFSTSSSNATIPTTTRVLEEKFKVSPTITNFSVPLGATVNMDGTALFEMVAAVFIAQVFGVDVGLTGYVSLIILMLVTSIGVAGVPGGSIPILMSAMAMVGIPPEGIAIVLGVDRLLDMGRTTVNVTGDITAALFVNKYYKDKFKD